MLSKFSVYILLMFIINRGIAQEHFLIHNIPEELKVRANAIIRDQQWTVDMRSPTDVVLQSKQTLTILNKVGLEHARLVIPYDKNVQIKSISGTIQNQSGDLIRKISSKDFLDESAVSSFSLFEDNRVKHFLPSVTHYPFTVTYEYELRLKQNLIIPDWIPNPHTDLSVENSRYMFLCGIDDQINIKELNFEGEHLEEQQGKQKKYTWTVSHILAKKAEPFSPPKEQYQTSIKIAPKKFSYYGKTGTYDNWADLGRWVYNDLLAGQQKPTSQMIAKVETLTTNSHSDIDKVKVLYNYLQQKTRYISVQIGIGGFQPMPASQVEQLGYGDCKALVNYMQTLLSIANIPSYYCVVYGGGVKRDMDADFASMTQGNHVILAVPLEKDTVWLECTSQKVPFGFLGSFTDNRVVFACTKEGGKLLRTPKFLVEDNLQKREGKFFLSEAGDIEGRFITSFYGNQYDNHLSMLGLPLQEQHRHLKELYTVDNTVFESINYLEEQEKKQRLIEELTVEIRSYAPKNGKRIYLLPNMFNRKSPVPTIKERIMPLYLNRGYNDIDSLIFTFPETYRIDLQPKQVELETEFGSYSMKLQLRENKLIFYRRLMLKEGQFAPDRYEAFAQFINTVYQTDLTKVVFLENL